MSTFAADDMTAIAARLKALEEEKAKAVNSVSEIDMVYGAPLPVESIAPGPAYNPLSGGWSYQAPDDYCCMSTYHFAIEYDEFEVFGQWTQD